MNFLIIAGKDPTELSPDDVMVQVEPGRFEFLGNISAIKDYQKKEMNRQQVESKE